MAVITTVLTVRAPSPALKRFGDLRVMCFIAGFETLFSRACLSDLCVTSSVTRECSLPGYSGCAAEGPSMYGLPIFATPHRTHPLVAVFCEINMLFLRPVRTPQAFAIALLAGRRLRQSAVQQLRHSK